MIPGELAGHAASGADAMVGLDNRDPIDTSRRRAEAASKSAGTITIKATASGLAAEPVTVTAQ